ncbi:hypothetical protein Poli38472_010346 [Pythium oligandrum]|uniref:Glycoside hydrolase n=1 Tax=Pythium oligandrum TaxID=41045 RepID=A0A8K1C2V4_PYTOL|nr:hypothetical protein Poli38472_010346 [Pythium oligandrum]|eukprot:TMW55464.1 hypothetical protein Poli38472_010346 [Pythium oligandrum]
MLRGFTKAILTTALLAVARNGFTLVNAAEELCALPTSSLVAAASEFPDCTLALDEVKKQAIATWYTDRETTDSYTQKAKDIVAQCPESSRITLVVYGLPNKDCDAGYSSGGVNKNADDYKKWVQDLATTVGDRKVLYVLEPDAVGLIAKGGCGVQNGYAGNVKEAIRILSANANADIYLDVGYWTLMSATDAAGVASTVKDLAQGGRIKGITLNTSNYRSNKEISDLCSNFQNAYGDKSLKCIADTSRNYKDPTSSEWCNAKFGGVGRPPTSNTGFDNLDYFIWIKPPGESDGTCDGGEHTGDSMKGPGAGLFFKEHFVSLWNNGYFVNEKKMPVIDGTIQQPITPSPTTPAPTPAVTTVTPTPTTTAPTSQVTPAPTTQVTPAPSTAAPVVTTPAPVVQRPENPSPTPAETTKKPKKKKDCPSHIEDDIPETPSTPAPTPAATAAKKNTTSTNSDVATVKALSYSAAQPPSADVPTVDANVQSDSSNVEEGGLGSGAIVGIVVAAAAVVGIAGFALRRGAEQRRRAKTMKTPVEGFGEIDPTPAQYAVTVL